MIAVVMMGGGIYLKTQMLLSVVHKRFVALVAPILSIFFIRYDEIFIPATVCRHVNAMRRVARCISH